MDNLEKTSAWVNDIVANAVETEKTDSKVKKRKQASE